MALRTIVENLIGAGLQLNLSNSDSAYIAAGVLVSSNASTAVYGNGSGRSVYLDGMVVAQGNGINLGDSYVSDSRQRVVIGETGSIKCFSPNSDAAIWIFGFASTVENDGRIWSTANGVYMSGESATKSSTILNTGKIDAALWGIWHGSAAAETLKIDNSGTIKGADGAIVSTSGNTASIEIITNTGKIVGDIVLEGGNDVYEGAGGRLSGAIFGGSGKDLLRGGVDNDIFNGGDDADMLFGGKGDDTLNGDAGNDVLSGDSGADILYGGLGKDTLTGGTGKDTFVFKSIGESTVASAGRDVIKDFSRADGDRISLKTIDADTGTAGNQAFTFIGTQGFHHLAGELRYKIKSGDTFISGDVDGDGVADFTIVLDLSLAMAATDFIL